MNDETPNMTSSFAPINRWHIVISGFMQTEGKPTGMVKLWRIMRLFTHPSVGVEIRSWCSNWSDMAELIWRCQPDSGAVDVRIYAYSWGGFSAMLLAKELGERGIDVSAMVLSDPVYRHWYRLGWWRAFVPWRRIVVPPNVRRVWWFRQRENFPRAHGLVAKSKERTLIYEPVLLERFHEYMDDAAAFHEQALIVGHAGEHM